MKRTLAAVLWMVVLIAGGAWGIGYRVIDLGVMGVSEALDINDQGWIVGHSRSDGDKGFLWKPGIGVAAYYTGGGFHAFATSINELGEVVGAAHVPGSAPLSAHAVIFPDVTELGTLPGGSQSWANAINNNGQIVGWSDDAGGAAHAFTWNNPTTDLGAGVANDINNSGLIVGQSNDHAVTWSGGQMTALNEPVGSVRSAAYGVNSGGAIVGCWWDVSDVQHPLLWQHGQDVPVALDGIGCALDINDLGQAVGGSFFWDTNGSVTDLGAFSAMAINDSGWIVGSSGGRAVLYQPVPEPSTLVLGVMGLIGMIGLRRRT